MASGTGTANSSPKTTPTKVIFLFYFLMLGHFSKGKKQGKGLLTFLNGEIFEGNFEADEKNGKGRLTYPSGNVYDGHWLNNLKHGNGHMHWST